MSEHHGMDILIVDSDAETSMLLKQAAMSVGLFRKVMAIRHPHEAVGKLASEDPTDLVFVSWHFDRQEILNFIAEARKTKHGEDAAYVMVLNTKNQDRELISQNMVAGIDGFLFEPYSIEYLTEIVQLARKVKAEKSDVRQRAAYALLVRDIIQSLDFVAQFRKLGQDAAMTEKRFKRLCEPLKNLSPELLEVYRDIAIEQFSAIPSPPRLFKSGNYKGASERVKKAAEKKLAAEAEAMLLKQQR